MLLRLFLCLALAAPALAAPDGKVTGLNANAFQTLTALSGSDWQPRHALALRAALWKDGQLDAAETDLLDELTQELTPPGSILIMGEDGATPLTRSTTSGRALVYLVWAKLPEHVRTKGWAEDWGPFLAYASQSPEQARQIVAFLTLDLGRFHASSNMANSYGPLRQRIQAMEERANALPAERAATVKALMYRAAEQLDRLELDQVHDFLYKYLQPKAELQSHD